MPNVNLLLQTPWKPLTEKETEAKKRGEKIERKPADKKTRVYAYIYFSSDNTKKKLRDGQKKTEEEKKQDQQRRNEYIIKLKTDFVISPCDWDFKKQQMKGTGAPEFNRRLLAFRQEVDTYFEKIVKDPAGYTLDQAKQMMKDFAKHKENPFLNKNKSFFEVFDQFIKERKDGKEHSYRTVQKYATLKAILQELAETNKKYRLLGFNMINDTFLNDFKIHLRSRPARGRQKTRPEGLQTGMLNDTVAKYISTLKQFLKWAEGKKYNTNTAYREFKKSSAPDKKRMVDKTKKPKKEIVSLTAQELKTLYQHEFKPKSTFDHVRDLFCFGCYTGQRISDIFNFNKDDLNGDVWTFISEKTLDEISIDLVGYSAPALDILKKYDYELPKISQQKFNDNIKLAAKEAGIDSITTINRYVGSKKIEIKKPKNEFLSSHAARRTCVSLLLNVYNMPITAVLGITGHSDIKTLQVYIDEDRAARREQMSRTKPVTEPLTLKKSAV